jgi:hypothetical protein
LPSDRWNVPVISGKGERVDRELVLFSVDYSEAAEKLDLSESLIKRYLQRFAELEIIKEVGGGRGTKHPKIYAIGTWVTVPEFGSRRNAFLHESSPWREKLRGFILR